MSSENTWMVAAAAALALLALWWLVRRRRGDRGDDNGSHDKRLDALDTVTGWPPETHRVLTQGQRRAYLLLSRALPEYIVLAQVPLARFIRVPTRNSYHEWMRRVGQLCADIVVCDAHAQVITVVEIRRGYGKDSERSERRHDRMDRVLNQAGVRVVVWSEEALPAPELIADQVLTTPRGMHSEEGGASVRTHAARPAVRPAGATTVAPPTSPVRDDLADHGAPTTIPAASLMQVLDEIDRQPMGGPADPPSSTWYDEFDSGRAPLDRLTPSGALKRKPG